MCAVHDGRCSPWVMCSVVSGNRIHDNNVHTRTVILTDRDIKIHTLLSFIMLSCVLLKLKMIDVSKGHALCGARAFCH